MAKWSGKVGFMTSAPDNISPDIWMMGEPTERTYFGDLMQNTKYRVQGSPDSTIDSFVAANTFSIVADQYAYDNWDHMIYVIFMGIKWKIENVEVHYPRLTITTGGKYDG